MSVKLIANYAKRLGLPGFSSHQFSVSVETEVHNVEDIAGESARLYTTLQQAVDAQIQQTGFVPDEAYGISENGGQDRRTNGNGNGNGNGGVRREAGISEAQLDLINRIVRENNANKAEIENLAVEMFGNGVRSLNKLQASGLIDELFERYPRRTNGSRGQRREVRS